MNFEDGMFWIFDCLVEQNLLFKATAIEKLKKLVSMNMNYQNNLDLIKKTECKPSGNYMLQNWI